MAAGRVPPFFGVGVAWAAAWLGIAETTRAASRTAHMTAETPAIDQPLRTAASRRPGPNRCGSLRSRRGTSTGLSTMCSLLIQIARDSVRVGDSRAADTGTTTGTGLHVVRED